MLIPARGAFRMVLCSVMPTVWVLARLCLAVRMSPLSRSRSEGLVNAYNSSFTSSRIVHQVGSSEAVFEHVASVIGVVGGVWYALRRKRGVGRCALR
jgi:hypothetical protein